MVSDTASVSFLNFDLPVTSSVRNFLRFFESLPSPIEVMSSTADAVDVKRWMAWSFMLWGVQRSASCPKRH